MESSRASGLLRTDCVLHFPPQSGQFERGNLRLPAFVRKGDRSSIMEMRRRTFVVGTLATLLLAGRRVRAEDKLPAGIEPVSHSKEEWRKILTPEQFAV